MSRKHRRAERAIARSAKWKNEQKRLAKLEVHRAAGMLDAHTIDAYTTPPPPAVPPEAEAAVELMKDGVSPLDAMAAAIRARKSG